MNYLTELQGIKEFSKTLKVLYVEDNNDARISTLKMLENLFTDITIGVDGVNGLEKFNNSTFDLVLTDINMPNKNGIDMIKDIKKLNNKIPCLIISAYNETDYFIEAIRLGVDGFLLKPIVFEHFYELLYKIIIKLQNEKEIKELASKQARLASLGEMMDAIAHQWKQPLGVIGMTLQSLDMKLSFGQDISSDMIKDASEVAQNQIEHLTSTIDSFRSFFRPNQKKVLSNIKGMIDATLLLMKDTLVLNNIEVEIIENEDTKIEVVENEFKHIFINLINNSKDAFNDNNIKNRKIIFEIEKEKDKVIIKIKDNAGGIPKNIINKVFESNFTTKAKNEGTGIGLYMTKQIVNKFSGSIEVENTNNGVCFSITFST